MVLGARLDHRSLDGRPPSFSPHVAFQFPGTTYTFIWALEGRLQEAHRSIKAAGNVRSNLDVLQALAHCLGAETFGDWKAALQERVPVVA